MDFLTLETSKGGFQHLLIITDHFTRYAQAIPCKNMTAKTTAEAFYNSFIVHYGIPRRIHSDQGANFESSFERTLFNLGDAQIQNHVLPSDGQWHVRAIQSHIAGHAGYSQYRSKERLEEVCRTSCPRIELHKT